MLHPYVERVWSFGYVFSFEVIHYWSKYAQKKKNSAFFIVSFSIEHMYGCASLLHWVCVRESSYESFLLRFHLDIYFGWEYESLIRFLREVSDLFLVSLDLCSIHHYIHFYVTYLHTLMQVDHHSFFYLFVFFYLYFIPSFHFTSFDLFLFSSCLMFDLGSSSTLYSCSLDVSIPLSSLFVWGSLGLRLMMFSTHCISCMKGMGIISLGSLSLVSFRFFHPKTLAYVTSCFKTTLRPWLYIMLDSSHMGNTWD